MKRLLLVLTLAFTVPAFAQVVDAGTVDVVLDAGPSYADAGDYSGLMDADGGVAIPAKLDDTAALVTLISASVKTGNGWLIAAAIVIVLVSLLRTAVKKLHDWLPDDNALDKVLFYIYDTKIGGWVLNWVTTISGGLLTAMTLGWEVNGALWLKILSVSTTASTGFELVKDIWEAIKNFIQKRKDAAAAATPPVTPPAETK